MKTILKYYLYEFVYTDGTKKKELFSSKTAADHFAMMEGDHLVKYYRISS